MAWLALIGSSLIGAIPSSYILVKLRTGKDIRKLGSGNAGATNVFRHVGKKEGLAVLAFDFLKGALAVTLFSGWTDYTFSDETWRLFLGLAAILGHVFTPFLGFKGGKGVATGGGVALAVYPLQFLVAIAVWAVVLRVSRYMSVASISAAWVFAFLSIFTLPDLTHKLIVISCACFITWTHRANIERLRKGQELPFIVNRNK